MRDSINRIEEIIDYAVELGHKVIAITDHETISNAVKVEKYYEKVKKEHPNFKVIRGNEIYLCRNGLNNQSFVRGRDKYYHFILLARDAIGHEQIRKISTRAWLRSYMGRGQRRVPTYYQDLIDIISINPGHIIGSTACLGGCLPTQILNYRDSHDEGLLERIKIWIRQMDGIFGHGNFFFELQPSASSEQSYVNKTLIKLSREMDIPYIITTDSHYLKKEDAPIHAAFLNAQNGDREVSSFYATTYMMGDNELRSYILKDLNEAELQEAYNNIRRISDMCEDYSLMKPLKIPQLKWKESSFTYEPSEWYDKIPNLRNFVESDSIADRELACKTIEGIMTLPECNNKITWDEVNECLEMTWISSQKNQASWAAYFLNLQKIIEECWNAGTLIGPSRGSGGGFILLYILGITQINPLREKVKVFNWRFLNPDRVSVLD